MARPAPAWAPYQENTGASALRALSMRTQFVSYHRPTLAAAKMIRRSFPFTQWSPLDAHQPDGPDRSLLIYTFDVGPACLRWILEPVVRWVFERKTRSALHGGRFPPCPRDCRMAAPAIHSGRGVKRYPARTPSMSANTKAAPSLGLLRFSLVVVWLATAFVSVWELHGQSLELLAKCPSPFNTGPQPWCWLVPVDAVIGLWLAWRPSRMAYATSLAVTIGMTPAATAINPSWWLHPRPADQEPTHCRHLVGEPLARYTSQPCACRALFLSGRLEPLQMNLYLLLKWLHIVSSVLMVGTGLGSAFYMFFTNRSGNVQAQAVVTRLVVRADWWFTTPTVLIQPATGLAMAYLAGWPLSTPWLAWSLALYALAGLCWLPVVWLQLRMRDMAQQAAAEGSPLPATYWRCARWWEGLQAPRVLAMAVVFFLMVNKPTLGG